MLGESSCQIRGCTFISTSSHLDCHVGLMTWQSRFSFFLLLSAPVGRIVFLDGFRWIDLTKMGFVDAEQSGFLARKYLQMCTVVNAKWTSNQKASNTTEISLKLNSQVVPYLTTPWEANLLVTQHTRNLLTRISELGHTTSVTLRWLHFSAYSLISSSADRGQCWTNNVKIVGIWFPTTTCSLQCQPVEKFWVINVEMHLHRWTNRRAHMHTHLHAHTKSGLTENVKHIRLSLPEKSCLISFCKYHLYTEDDSSCHLSVSPPV